MIELKTKKMSKWHMKEESIIFSQNLASGGMFIEFNIRDYVTLLSGG